MKIKKIIASILLAFITFSISIPFVSAKENPIYRFERYGGIFTLPDNEYTFKLNDVVTYKAKLKWGQIYSLRQDWPDWVFENRFDNQTLRWYLYINTDELPKSWDIVPVFHIESSNKDNYFDNSFWLHWVGIFYDPKKKQIFAFVWNSNKNTNWESTKFILYENIDHNTPNFMMYVWASAFWQYRWSDNVPHLSYTLILFRETQAWNGIIRSWEKKEILMGFDRLKENDFGAKFFRNTFAEMQQYTLDWFSDVHPWDLCTQVFKVDTWYSSPEYADCIQKMSDQINFSYLDTWRDRYWLWINKENTNVDDWNDSQIWWVSGKFGLIKKIDMEKPQVPTCSFSDSFLWLSCLGEWLSYSFQSLIYFFVTIYNSLIDFFNAIISFVVNFFKNLFDGIKSIFGWIFETIKNYLWAFIEPFWTNIGKPVWEFFYGFFKPLWEIATGKSNFESLFWWNQAYICQKSSWFYIDTETPTAMRPAELLGFFFYLANPIPPQDWWEICTNIGVKKLKYWKSTIIDTTVFLFFITAGLWFLFYIVRE